MFVKNKFSKSLLPSVVFLLLVCNLIQAQEIKKGSIEGVVTDPKDQRIPGVNVVIPQLHRGTATDIQGNYALKALPPGEYTIEFSFVGYESPNRSIIIQRGEVTKLDITLEPSTITSESITVTGSPTADDPMNIPADVKSLNGIAKIQNQATSLGASLEQLAGVTNISTGSQVGKPVIRGLSGSRVRILKNNAAMEFQQFGVRHPPNVDPFMAERIEVVRGAASIQYGSDALGGAINVISNHPPDALGKDGFVNGEIINEFYTNNDEYVGGIHLEGAKGGLGFTGTFMGRTSDNITAPDVATFQETDNTEAPKFSDELNDTDFRQINGSFGMGYKAGFGGISIRYERFDNEQNFLQPNGVGLGQMLRNDMVQAEANIAISNKLVLKPLFSYGRNSRESSPDGPNAITFQNLSDSELAIDIVRETFIGRLEASHNRIGIFSGEIGFEFKRDDQSTFGPVPLVPSGDINNYAMWVFEKANLGDLTLNVGLRGDLRRQEAKPNEVLKLPDFEAGETDDVLDQSFDVVTGSVGLNYRFQEHFAISSNFGSGFRAPSFFDLHVNGVHGGIAAFQSGNPDLDSERSYSTDLSLKWKSSKYRFNVTWYRNKINNFIFLFNTGEFAGEDGPPILQNVQNDVRLLGGDISATGQVLSWLQLEGTFEKVDGHNNDTGDELPLMPPTRLKGKLKFMQEKFGAFENPFFSIAINHTANKDAAGPFEPFWQFGNAPQFSDFGVASTDSYTLINLKAGANVRIMDDSWYLELGVENLLDEAYRDFLDTYKGYALNPGRNVQLKLRIPFSTQ